MNFYRQSIFMKLTILLSTSLLLSLSAHAGETRTTNPTRADRAAARSGQVGTPADIQAIVASEPSLYTAPGGKTNNHNFMTQEPADQAKFKDGECGAKNSCPSDMAFVCSPVHQLKACVDIELPKDNAGVPGGNFTYNTCKQYCEDQGKRMISNNEWMLAALGTKEQDCLPGKQRGIPGGGAVHCQGGSTAQQQTALNATSIKQDRSSCTSAFGVKDMVGVLGQWVENGHAKPGKEQFNGGFWNQPASSIYYRTTAHDAQYCDYSISCRCAADAK
jgi:formylglycine-generating enzyme required for sulfatase activity